MICNNDARCEGFVYTQSDGTCAANEKCRKELHALRFETETECFAPPGAAPVCWSMRTSRSFVCPQ